MGSVFTMPLESSPLVLALLLASGCTALDTIINLPSGDIEGNILQSRDGNEYASFEGVPYGEKPVRWMPPAFKASWEGTGALDCTKPGPMCLQADPYTPGSIIGSEDCLSMNIYTTSTSKDGQGDGLPVIVFLHGGGMVMGAGQYYKGDFLVDHSVISITINYRLDLLGFFSLDSPRISGNQALRDVQLGLRWVKENIQYFGGDPERVVLSGQSGGSWATSMVYASPLSESLISGAIFESGTVLGPLGYPYDTREEALEKSKIVANELDCYSLETVWNPEEVQQCMMKKTAEEVLLAGTMTHISWASNGVIDSISEHGSVLPLPLEDILLQGLFPQVPLMIGTMSNEDVLFSAAEIADPSLLNGYNDDKVWESLAISRMFPQKSLLNKTDNCDVKYAKLAKTFYFGDTLDSDDLLSYVTMGSDIKFAYGTQEYMDYMRDSQVPVYNFRMSFQDNTSFSFATGTVGKGLGVAHGDELPYIYKIDPLYYDVPYADWSDHNIRHSQRMCRLWANFAKHGNPTPDEGSEILGDVKWEKYESGNPMFMDLGLEFKMKSDPELMKRMAFWKETLANYGSEQCNTFSGDGFFFADFWGLF